MTGKEAQNLILLELMAPSLDEDVRLLSEEESDAIHERFIQHQHNQDYDWDYLLEPIVDIKAREKYIDLLKALNND